MRDTTPVDRMADFVPWATVGGGTATLATAILKRTRWPREPKLGVFFARGCFVAAGEASYQRRLDWHRWSRTLPSVVATGLFADAKAKPAITQIEARTGEMVKKSAAPGAA